MAIIYHVPDDIKRKHFTHKGWFLGVVPVWLELKPDNTVGNLIERNWVPVVFLDFVILVAETFGIENNIGITGTI